jgi:hypothetical protein
VASAPPAPFAEMPVMTVLPTRTGEPVMAACESGVDLRLPAQCPVVASIPSMFGPGTAVDPLMTPTTSVLPASDGLVRT